MKTKIQHTEPYLIINKFHHPLGLLLALLALAMTPGVGWGQTNITALSSITDSNGHYVITQDITGGSPGVADFSGTLEAAINPTTKMPYRITGLSAPLFTTLSGTVKNLLLVNVAITSGDASGNTGAIACTASGRARIYNVGVLSGSVGGSGNVGGLVGLLDGNPSAPNNETNNAAYNPRVVNCYSFADITSGSVKAGIVGYNNYASKSGDIRTMVMNCMFYGDITEAEETKVSPVYGGKQISNNNSNKLNNYNYFCYENLPSTKITDYNSALAAEERFLDRFEFYRLLLNSTRELAAYYVGATLPDLAGGEKRYDKSKIAKWVLDKSIAPYPILKLQGNYPSVINYDATSAPDTPESTKTLNVTLNGTGINTHSLSLPIKDKDPDNYNYNYHKVQLPYFNDVGTGNYQDNKVVTGWKITAMEGNGSTQGNFYNDSYEVTMSADGNSIIKTPYNYADRSTYAKDLYSESGQVFSQGAYFNVPEGVTSITIEPYWANCVYLSDPYYDKYGYAAGDVTDFGKHYVDGNSYFINGSEQKVYTSVDNAYNALSNKSSVYDNAIVLVGNYHKGNDNELKSSNSRPYTLMSIDLDNDNEPDYSIIFRSGKQKDLYSIRYDFINMPGAAMAHKTPSNANMGIPGNCKVRGWFEITNTALIRFNQFEYDNQDKTSGYPLILLGGVIEQFVSTNYATDANININHTTNIHLGGNVWFKMFSNGVHADKTKHKTARRPISVTGGEYEIFYLSGYFQPNSPYYENESAECYIDGGKFGEVAGAGQEKIDGNVAWVINHADIEKFYGGGINPDKPISGNIFVDIKNSNVDKYCGGPKFGNMDSDKTVKTFANHCAFATYYGAGNGGTALVRQRTFNDFNYINYGWNTDSDKVGTFINSNGANKRGKYDSSKGGISISYEYEHFEGSSDKTVGRFYVNYASLSTAQTNDVSSTLTDCTITRNYYGGGNLGKVAGNVTSTLTNCTVKGNMFGAGYSASAPTADVFPASAFANYDPESSEPKPWYNQTTGVFEKGEYPTAVQYTWSSTGDNSTNTLIDDGNDHWIHTSADNLEGLGVVSGNISLTLKGNTTVGTLGDPTTGNVYGGGDESAVSGNTTVNLQGGAHVLGNVYGGGNLGAVGGDSQVNILE